MHFSKCDIEIEDNRVKIDFGRSKREHQVVFERSFYKEFAYYKKKSDFEMNRWLFGGVQLVILIGWVTLSEHYGMTYPFKYYDNWIMPILLILFFVSLFFDVLGDMYVVRYVIRLLFFWKKKIMVIILNSGKEYQIPVRSESEAIQIDEFLKG